MNKKNLFILLLTLASLGLLFYSFVPAKKTKLKYKLGFSINPSISSTVITYVLIGFDSVDNKIITKKSISEGNFVMYSKGLLKCKANPKRKDFFKEAGVDCGLIIDDPKSIGGVLVADTLWDEMKPICLPVWDIWKLRYSIHPKYGKGATTVPEEDRGWSANRWRPSYAQTLYLQKYGIKQIQDYFHGEKMYELFKDMQNPDWIRMYKELN